MEFQGVAAEDPSSSTDLNDDIDIHNIGNSAPPQESRIPILQQNSQPFHLPPIPGQRPLPDTYDPALEASRSLIAVNSDQARPVPHVNNYFSPSPSTGLPIPGQQSSLAPSSIQRQRSPRHQDDWFKVLLNVAPKDVRGRDIVAGVDFKSSHSYMSHHVASEIGLEVRPYAFSPLYSTSRGTFTPERFAANANIWSYVLGIPDNKDPWNIAITPDNWGEVPLKLGMSAVAKLGKKSQIFESNMSMALRQRRHQLARRFPPSNWSAVASSSQRAPPSSAAQPRTPSQSTPYTMPEQQNFASSSANVSSYTPPTPATVNRSSTGVLRSAASGSYIQDHLQCPPNNLSLPSSLAAENQMQVTNGTQPTVEEVEMHNFEETTIFHYSPPFPSNPESSYGQ